MAAILREGLDPKRRTGQALGVGEYFGGNAVVSLPYCRGGSKMVVFAVLTDPSGVTAQVANKDVVVVHKVHIRLKVRSTLEEEHVQRKRVIKEQRKGGKREREKIVIPSFFSLPCLQG